MVVIPKVGLKSKIFARTLMSAHFWASHSLQELQKRGGQICPLPLPPGQLNKILKFDSLVVLTLTLFQVAILTFGWVFSGTPYCTSSLGNALKCIFYRWKPGENKFSQMHIQSPFLLVINRVRVQSLSRIYDWGSIWSRPRPINTTASLQAEKCNLFESSYTIYVEKAGRWTQEEGFCTCGL